MLTSNQTFTLFYSFFYKTLIIQAKLQFGLLLWKATGPIRGRCCLYNPAAAATAASPGPSLLSSGPTPYSLVNGGAIRGQAEEQQFAPHPACVEAWCQDQAHAAASAEVVALGPGPRSLLFLLPLQKGPQR